MKTNTVRDALLALVAAGALLAFILACTSFSPDDSKVLYPTIDSDNGAVGVAVYDRNSRRSETLFFPIAQDVEDGESGPVFSRAQWTAGGREVVVAWPWLGSSAEIEEDGLNIAVLPVAGGGSVRVFQLPELSEAGARLMYPLPIAGSDLFLVDTAEETVIRMDLRTGATRRFDGMSELFLLPTSRTDRLLYLGQEEEAESTQVGWMRTDNGVRTTLFQIPSLDLDTDDAFFAIAPDSQRFAVLDRSGPRPVCRIIERGRADRTLPLELPEGEVSFGNALFSPDGEVIYVSLQAPASGSDGHRSQLGFMEVPVDGRPVRRTTLVEDLGDTGFETAMYWQIALSSDGRALAVASTYYALEPDTLKAGDCALFLVDLSDPKRPVTKVPVPLPPKRGSEDD